MLSNIQSWVLFRLTKLRRRFYVYRYESFDSDEEPVPKAVALLGSCLCTYIAHTKIKISGTSNINDNVIKILLNSNNNLDLNAFKSSNGFDNKNVSEYVLGN